MGGAIHSLLRLSHLPIDRASLSSRRSTVPTPINTVIRDTSNLGAIIIRLFVDVLRTNFFDLCVRGTAERGTDAQIMRDVLDRRDALDLMHGRSRMTMDPRVPTMPGRSMTGFHGGYAPVSRRHQPMHLLVIRDAYETHSDPC